MKKVIILNFLLFLTLFGAAQSRLVGYVFNYQTGSKEAFEYSISTRFSNEAFQTVYEWSKPGVSKARYTIIASHFKADKKVIVEVKDEQYLLSVMNGKEELQYETETVQPFGIRGNLGFFDKSAPNQLSVQFISGRFEYVRVLSFMGSYSDGNFQFFLFNKNDKISEPTNITDASKSKVPRVKSNLTAEKDSITNRLFTGTKNFCDEGNTWKYVVTISSDSITLKLFPGSANSYFKEKDKPREIIKGIVDKGKIIIKDSPEFLTNRFKYENGILYEVNNEGDYNDYPECK